jgi:penicillin-binding protein 1A
MKYLWYGFLGLFSLGFLGAFVAVAGIGYIISYYGRDLPDYNQLKDYEPPIVTRLYAGDGRLVAEFAQEKRVFVPVESIPDLVKNAFIAAEDKNFYEHQGVDIIAVARAVVQNIQNAGSGRRPVGASTITQQVAKNFLLTNEVSYERKIKEAILAYRMEKAISKDRLLELYLNEIFLGFRAYGIAAASLQYFNKSLDELSVAEAAYLAALPKAPNNYHPVRKYDEAIARRNWVVDRMLEENFITRAEAELAKASPLKTVDGDESRVANAPYFAEEIRRTLADQYGEESLYGGGLVVRSTLEPRLQDIAVQALRDGLMAYDKRHGWRGALVRFETMDDWATQLSQVVPPESILQEWSLAVVIEVSASKAKIGFADQTQGTIPLEEAKWARESQNEGYALGPVVTDVNQVLKTGDVIMVEPLKDGPENHYALRQIPLIQGAVVAMDPHTGRVLAMQGGWQHDTSQFNRATQAQRQSGSAFKPFIYLAALEHGFTPATLILDAPFTLVDRPGNVWSPTNYSGEYYGPTPLRVGVEKSRNLMTVRLADYLGLEMVADYAQRFGIIDNMPHFLSNALGASETTLLDLTTAYAMLVNGGKKIEPSLIDRIQDRRGNTVLKSDQRGCTNCGTLIKWQNQDVPQIPDEREQVADPRAAYQMVSILEGVVQRGTATRISSLGYPLAGKTGTTNESKDTWFIGFSPDLVVGVFAGFDDPRSLGKRETGASVAVPIFKDFMAAALKDTPPTPFRIPPGIRQVQINADTGVRAQPGDENLIWEAFVAGTEPTDDMFILDERGIMPASSSSGGTDGGEGEDDIIIDQQQSTQGTGGLY